MKERTTHCFSPPFLRLCFKASGQGHPGLFRQQFFCGYSSAKSSEAPPMTSTLFRCQFGAAKPRVSSAVQFGGVLRSSASRVKRRGKAAPGN